MAKQGTLPLVEEVPKQGREAESQKWDWVEAEVWTGRMLATLENGVKGGPMPTLSNRAVYHDHSPCRDQSVPPWTPLTGEPDAGDLHVRFGGGRGRELTVPSYPYHSGSKLFKFGLDRLDAEALPSCGSFRLFCRLGGGQGGVPVAAHESAIGHAVRVV